VKGKKIYIFFDKEKYVDRKTVKKNTLIEAHEMLSTHPAVQMAVRISLG
jgi:hypothetical protein